MNERLNTQEILNVLGIGVNVLYISLKFKIKMINGKKSIAL